ncbi:hypothetical protein ACFFLM_21185 [Deinococcus oregonensis]|uniref:Replication initiation protein n=1 Tax=Deinococcus oregonensis TaxID=1805970 RepID=A0ABV6B3Y2_9DEIO
MSANQFLADFRAKQQARGVPLGPLAPLFDAVTLQPRPEATEPFRPAPLAPSTATVRPQPGDVPAPQYSGCSPIIKEAYSDIKATAQKIAERSLKDAKPLPKGPRRLYEFLVEVAVGNTRLRGLSNLPTVAEFHLPAELLAELLDVGRTTLWRWCKELGDHPDELTGEILGAQLVARHDHKTGSIPLSAQKALEAQQKRAGKTGSESSAGVSDGMLWAVSLAGAQSGLAVSSEALRHEWRDLYTDSLIAGRKKGTAEGLRTVWAIKKRGMKQSLEDLRAVDEVEMAVKWTVNPGFGTSAVPLTMTVPFSDEPLESLWNVKYLRGLRLSERGAAVSAAAEYLAQTMNDTGSVKLYAWVLWKLVALDEQGVNLWDQVLLILDQVRGDLRDKDADHGGQLFVWRLKFGSPSLWDQLKNAPVVRVGKAV